MKSPGFNPPSPPLKRGFRLIPAQVRPLQADLVLVWRADTLTTHLTYKETHHTDSHLTGSVSVYLRPPIVDG